MHHTPPRTQRAPFALALDILPQKLDELAAHFYLAQIAGFSCLPCGFRCNSRLAMLQASAALLPPLELEPWRLSDEANAMLTADGTAPGSQSPPAPPPPPDALAAWAPEPWMLSEDAHTLLRAVADTPPMLAPSRCMAAAEPCFATELEQPSCRLLTRSWDGLDTGGGQYAQLPSQVVRLGARLSSV